MATILIVHKDSEFLDQLKNMVESIPDFRTILVSDVDKAIETFKTESISCVILGHQKPDLNGKKFLREKRDIKKRNIKVINKYVPVILCLDQNNDTEYWKCDLMDGSITTFISELCSPRELQELLHEICIQKVKNKVWQRTLKERDLNLQVFEMPLILRQAQDFLRAHQILKDHNWSNSKTEKDPVFFADMVNLSFAIELFFKALLSKNNMPGHGHNLEELFYQLPFQIQKEIEYVFNEHRLKKKGRSKDIFGFSFEDRLSQHSELFQSWRYYYEEIRPSFYSEFFDVLAVVLNDLTQAYCAEWIETSGRSITVTSAESNQDI